jgi:hypothetical protein
LLFDNFITVNEFLEYQETVVIFQQVAQDQM